MVADALEVEKIDETGWSLVQDHLRGWIGSPDRLVEDDGEAMDGLIEGLVMSGLAMQAYQTWQFGSAAAIPRLSCYRRRVKGETHEWSRR